MFEYKTRGTCSEKIELEIDKENKITFCKFYRGCAGNTAGLAKMVIGRDADEVKALLRGVPCRGSTSCTISCPAPSRNMKSCARKRMARRSKTMSAKRKHIDRKTIMVRVICIVLALLLIGSSLAALFGGY